MNRRALLLGLTIVVIANLGWDSTEATASPLYDVHTNWGDTNLPPGGEGQFVVQARNIGDTAGAEDLLISDELPAGVQVKAVRFETTTEEDLAAADCSGVGTEIASCGLSSSALSKYAGPPGTKGGFLGIGPSGFLPTMYIDVEVSAGVAASGTNTATLTGGGAAAPARDVKQVPFGTTPARFGLAPESYEADFFDSAYPLGSLVRQAGDRPFELRVNFDFTQKVGSFETGGKTIDRPIGRIKTVEATLPHGLMGNPEATPKCNPVDFANVGANSASGSSTACPSDTQVGYLNIRTNNFIGGFTRVPIYNLVPPKGVPADFGFNTVFVQAHIYPNVDPSQDYAIKTVTPNISNVLDVLGSEVTIWGVPGDPVHDKFRAYPHLHEGNALGAPWGSAAIRPLLTAPSDCGFVNGGTKIRVDSYQHPGEFTSVQEYANPFDVKGCNDSRFRFEPSSSLQPTSKAAGGPAGLTVHLTVPQRNDEVEEAPQLYAQNGDGKAIPTPPLKKAVVKLPEGMTVNPAAAQGLASCTPQEIGLGTDSPVACPDSSQFGTLTLHTPILPVGEQPEGFVYIAKQNDNPFHNFLSLYLVIQEPDRGILVKVPGRVDLDPQTGQITTTFDDLPQFPVSDVEMHVKGGLRAGLVNPQTCGTKTVEATFYSWQSPQTPHVTTSSYDVTANPDGSPCHNSLSERPFAPRLTGGTLNNVAGSYSPMELHMTRTDEDQELSRVEGTAPPGLLASLKGVGRCSDAAIAAAANPDRTGLEEINSPSCPANSLVGTVDAGAGVGQVLTYVGGKVYLAGPYKGAPLSGVAIVPAVAGPFDLGTVVTRAPAYVNPRTAELSVKTDPLPLIFKGVPVRVRDIQVHLNRQRFTLNPTNCEPFALTGTLFSSEGKAKSNGSRFQAADCASLGFKPRLQTRLFGGTPRGAHPEFRGIFRAREGDANAASAIVTLPRSEFLDQAHIRTVCTRVQFAAGGGNGEQCPAGSIYGLAEATTPLLDETLQGPVYLRSSNHKLPDLVADLHGIVDVEVVGRIDSINGGIRANFESIPDAPVQQFKITMQGGKKGLLVNSTDLCAKTKRAIAKFTAQSGKAVTLHPKMQIACGRARKHRRHH